MNWPFDPLPPSSYDLIMIDPPWSFENWSEKGKTKKGAAGQYDVMSIDAIKALPVAALARKNAVLWLWATHPMIDQQIDVARHWGFTFTTTGVWVKRTKNGKLGFGTGRALRCASEPFIIAKIGSPAFAKNVRTVIEGPLRQHSRKPDEAYREAERLMPAARRRADIFTREIRPGWCGFGDELTKFGETHG